MRCFKELAYLLVMPVALMIWIFGLWEDKKNPLCRFYLWLLDGSRSKDFRKKNDDPDRQERPPRNP